MLLVDLEPLWRFEKNLHLVIKGKRSDKPSPAGDVDMRTPLAALEGGVNAIQLREPHEEALALVVAATHKITSQDRVRPLTFLKLSSPSSSAGLAHLLDAGVHIPEEADSSEGLSSVIDDIRAGSWGENIPVSCAVHSIDAAVEAEAAGADLLIVGTVFPSKSHPGRAAIGIDGLRAVCAGVTVPVVAIGGITEENAGAAILAGARGVAVISAIWDASDPRSAASALRKAIEEAWRDSHAASSLQ